MESRSDSDERTWKSRRRLAMKITYMTAAQALLFLAVCLPEAAQTSVNPNHGSDRSPQISVSTQEDQVKARQQQLEGYEKQLRAKAEQVENARQQAISAGIQGDGAGPFIDAYRQEQKELEVLQAALAPQIERMRTLIVNLTMPALRSDSAPTPKMTPARPARTVLDSNSRERFRR